MRLLIDIGNTRIKWYCVGHEGVISAVRNTNAVTHKQRFSEAIKSCFGEGSNFLAENSNESIHQVVVSNVAGERASNALLDYASRWWKVKPRFVGVSKRTAGIENHYEILSELGVDRWVAIVGARDFVLTGAVIVVNCGTAITVDLLTHDDQFQGGVILPGFQLASAALSQTDGIGSIEPSVESCVTPKVVGTRTRECVRLGVFAACVGGVESVIESIQRRVVSGQAKVLLSGGAAPLFLDASNLDCEYDANVIMRGLNRVIECES